MQLSEDTDHEDGGDIHERVTISFNLGLRLDSPCATHVVFILQLEPRGEGSSIVRHHCFGRTSILTLMTSKESSKEERRKRKEE